MSLKAAFILSLFFANTIADTGILTSCNYFDGFGKDAAEAKRQAKKSMTKEPCGVSSECSATYEDYGSHVYIRGGCGFCDDKAREAAKQGKACVVVPERYFSKKCCCFKDNCDRIPSRVAMPKWHPSCWLDKEWCE